MYSSLHANTTLTTVAFVTAVAAVELSVTDPRRGDTGAVTATERSRVASRL